MVDPDQMVHLLVSDLSVYCLLKSVSKCFLMVALIFHPRLRCREYSVVFVLLYLSLSIHIPQLLTILILKFESTIYYLMFCLKIAR